MIRKLLYHLYNLDICTCILEFDRLNACLIEWPSYGDLFGRITTASSSRVATIALLFVHSLHLGYVLFTESVPLTKFYLLFLRNGVNIASKLE